MKTTPPIATLPLYDDFTGPPGHSIEQREVNNPK